MTAKIGLWSYKEMEVDHDEPGLVSFVAHESNAGINDEHPERFAHIDITAQYNFGGEEVTLEVEIYADGEVGGGWSDPIIAKTDATGKRDWPMAEWGAATIGDRTLADWIADVRAFVAENFGGFYEYASDEDEEPDIDDDFPMALEYNDNDPRDDEVMRREAEMEDGLLG
jgi:hypothetical protein